MSLYETRRQESLARDERKVRALERIADGITALQVDLTAIGIALIVIAWRVW